MEKTIISINQLDLPINYLELSDDIKSRLCKKVIEESLRKMTVKANLIQKINAMNAVLDKSLAHNVEHEYYETAAILRDLKKELVIYAYDQITQKETRNQSK